MLDSLQNISNVIQSNASSNINELETLAGGGFNWWMLIAIMESVLILILLAKLRKPKVDKIPRSEKFDALKKAKSQDIDMGDLMNNINSSRSLYKELSRKCHPDRFQDESSREKAEQLFKEITENKRNHAKLTELKKQSINTLKIKF